MGLLYRFWQIFWGLVPPIALIIRDYHLSLIMGTEFSWHTHQRRRRARKLVATLARLGPTFIKLAQVLAARADLFPGVYLDELRELHDRVPPTPTRDIMRQFEKATGRRANAIFGSFDPVPIASASLGQVHSATYQGRRVAVKILKPRIRRVVNKDLQVIAVVFSLATLFFQNPYLNSLITIFEEFSRTIHEEMDLALEAEHIRYFRARYAGDDRVLIPEVIAELSGGDVLVMEFIEGLKISDVDGIRAAGHDVARLVDRLVEIFAEQILRDGIFHADPHPGNIFVNDQGQIGLVDFGLVLQVTREQRDKYVDVVLAAGRADYERLVEIGFELDMVSPDINPAVMREAARRIMSIGLRDDLGPLQMQRIAHQIMQVFYEFPIHLPGELVYVMKTLTLVEGLGALYQPGYNLLKDALPTLRRLVEPDLERFEQHIGDRILQEGRALLDLYQNLKYVAEVASRGELSIRIYRGDMAEIERLIGYTMRKFIILMAIFGGGMASLVLYLGTGALWVLVAGGALTLLGMFIMFIMPNTPKTPRIILPRRGPRT